MLKRMFVVVIIVAAAVVVVVTLLIHYRYCELLLSSALNWSAKCHEVEPISQPRSYTAANSLPCFLGQEHNFLR